MSKLFKGEQVVVENFYTLCRTAPPPAEEQSPEAGANGWDGECLSGNEDVLEQIKRQADEIMSQAEAFREQTIKQAEDEALRLYENARQSGYEKGYADGTELAEEKSKSLVGELQAYIKRLDDSKEALLEECRRQTLMLACDIARKVIDKQLECEDESFIAIYKNAVRDLYDKKHIRLKVSKHERDFVTSSADYLLSLVKGASHLELEVLEDAERGTCIVETDEEIIDASAQRQADVIEQAILEQ